jgi:protein-tyrosine phosphatase
MAPARLLFVCTGNICRSPTAEGVLLHKAAQAGLAVTVDSAGTSDEEAGNPPHPRSQQVAAARGYRLPDHRARRLRRADFERFDRILAMTRAHLRIMERLAPAASPARLELLMAYAPDRGVEDVPDPWYGGSADFEHALDLIEAGCAGLLAELLRAR